MENDSVVSKSSGFVRKAKILLIKILCCLAIAPFAASLINGGVARCYERYESIRASIAERFREVQIVREYLPREQKPLAKIIKDAAQRHGVSSLLLTALVTQESGQQMRPDRMRYEPHLQGRFKCPTWANEAECKAYATSWGLAQVVYGFWKDACGLESYSDLLDPEINLNCGASIMGACLARNTRMSKVERYKLCLGQYNGDKTGNYAREVLEHLTNLVIEKEL